MYISIHVIVSISSPFKYPWFITTPYAWPYRAELAQIRGQGSMSQKKIVKFAHVCTITCTKTPKNVTYNMIIIVKCTQGLSCNTYNDIFFDSLTSYLCAIGSCIWSRDKSRIFERRTSRDDNMDGYVHLLTWWVFYN